VTSLVILQNSMDLLKGEVGSTNKRYATSTVDGNDANGREAEMVLDTTGEMDQDGTTITAIKREPYLSCLPTVSVTDISYRLYTELPAFA